MSTLLNLLAVAGGAAAAWHMMRAALRFLQGAAKGIWTEEMGKTHAWRGDLTSLEEARRERQGAAQERRRWGLVAAGWLLLLAVPSLTGFQVPLYAAYSVLWLGPLTRLAREVL